MIRYDALFSRAGIMTPSRRSTSVAACHSVEFPRALELSSVLGFARTAREVVGR